MHDLAAFRFHGHVVQGAKGGFQFTAKIEIGGGIDVVGQGQRLVDGFNAKCLGVARVVDR